MRKRKAKKVLYELEHKAGMYCIECMDEDRIWNWLNEKDNKLYDKVLEVLNI